MAKDIKMDNEFSSHVPWYKKTGWIIAFLILFAPVGIYLMWRFSPWSRNLKWCLTAASVGFVIYVQVDKRLEEKSQTIIEANKVTNNTQPSVPAIIKPVGPNPLGVPSDFHPAYIILEEKRSDLGNIPRIILRISLPSDVPSAQIEINIKHALWDSWQHAKGLGLALGAVAVFAYRPGDNFHDTHTVGKADFAPGGEWGQANPGVPVEQWQATISLNSGVQSTGGKSAPADWSWSVSRDVVKGDWTSAEQSFNLLQGTNPQHPYVQIYRDLIRQKKAETDARILQETAAANAKILRQKCESEVENLLKNAVDSCGTVPTDLSCLSEECLPDVKYLKKMFGNSIRNTNRGANACLRYQALNARRAQCANEKASSERDIQNVTMLSNGLSVYIHDVKSSRCDGLNYQCYTGDAKFVSAYIQVCNRSLESKFVSSAMFEGLCGNTLMESEFLRNNLTGGNLPPEICTHGWVSFGGCSHNWTLVLNNYRWNIPLKKIDCSKIR